MTERARDDMALDWVRRVADPSFDDWEGHLAWLEADPRNAAAFNDACLLMEQATDGLASASPAPFAPTDAVNENAGVPMRGRRWAWLAAGGAAIAASLIALVDHRPLRSATQEMVVATQAGETRQVSLADGTRVTLNGDTRIAFDRAAPRHVRLDRGEVFFAVAPAKGRHFVVSAGDAVFQDLATAFDVTRDRGSVRLEVQEGAVLYDPAHAALRLNAGQHMRVADGTATIQEIDPAAAGGWRTGRLIYRDAPLPVIAGDLERVIGTPIGVEPTLQERHFSGVIVMTKDRAALFRRIEAVMHVKARHVGQGWRLERAVP